MTLDDALKVMVEAAQQTAVAARDVARQALGRIEALAQERLPGAVFAEPPGLGAVAMPSKSTSRILLVPGAETVEGAELVEHLKQSAARVMGVDAATLGPGKDAWVVPDQLSGRVVTVLFGRRAAEEYVYEVFAEGRVVQFRIADALAGIEDTRAFFGDDLSQVLLLLGLLSSAGWPSERGALMLTRWHGPRPGGTGPLLAWVLRHMAETALDEAGAFLMPDLSSRIRQLAGPDSQRLRARQLLEMAESIERAYRLEARDRLEQAHGRLAELFQAAYPVRLGPEYVAALVLDALRPVPTVLGGLPPPDEVFRLDGLPLPREAALSREWGRLGDAVHLAVARLRLAARDHARTRVVVAGFAPHATFVQAGMATGRWCGRQTVASPGREGTATWDALDLAGPVDTEEPAFFDLTRGLGRLEPSRAVGRLAVFVGLAPHTASAREIAAFFEAEDEVLADIVELRTTRTELTSTGARVAALEAGDALRRMRALYPRTHGLALFIAGPGALGFIIGRAVDPSIFGDVWTTHYARGAYTPALQLPWPGPPLPEEQVRLSRVELDGYRGLGDFEMALDARLTVLIGTNGAGKTGVLDALAMLLGQLFDAIPHDAAERHWMLTDITVGQGHIEGSARLHIGSKELSLTSSRSIDQLRLGGDTHEWVDHYRQAVRADASEANLPIAVYYTTDRSRAAAVDRRADPPAAALWQTRLEGFRGALAGGDAGFDGFFWWLKEREDLENAERVQDPLHRDRALTAVRRAIADLMPGFHNPRVQRRPLRFCIDKGATELSGAQLSSGERGVIALAGDIARRLADANPGRSDPLRGAGIVLIDEVELHLHPGWQRRVLPGLLDAFPSCQFVVTTHSPQVLGHVEARQVRILRRREGGVDVAQPDAAYGLDANRLLEDIFGVPRQPAEIQSEIASLYDHLDAGRFAEAREVYDHVRERVGIDDHPELVRARIWLARLGPVAP